MEAFVEPETLTSDNQYKCEQCQKKCDAHKGLQFKSFPYLLTLQLKRFDFDYSTMHRIKLNDRSIPVPTLFQSSIPPFPYAPIPIIIHTVTLQFVCFHFIFSYPYCHTVILPFSFPHSFRMTFPRILDLNQFIREQDMV